MSELLQTWVLQETGIQLADLSQDFSTGYKLGEVLAKLNLQPDFEMFQQNPTPEALVNNFTRLQPTLKSLGIKFDTRRANALVLEDKGVASQLLYEIRSAVQDHRDHVKSTSSPPLGKTLGVKGTLNRTLLQVHQHRNKLGSFEKFQGDHFEELMRQHAANPKAMSMELHVQRFTDEGARQAAAAVAGEKTAQEMAERSRRAFHDSCTDRSAAARKKAADLEGRVAKIHTASQKHHRELKEKDARAARTVKQKEIARKQAAQEAETNEMIRSIQSFEERLEKSGLSATVKTAGDDTADSKAMFGTTPLDQSQRLKQFLPDTQKMQKEAEEYMQRLHDRRKLNVRAAKERRVRRYKLLQEEAAATEAAQHQEDRESALKALNRHSEEEQRIEERLSQLQAEEAVLVANREQRMAQYSERRQQDHSDAIKREEELSKSLKGQVSEEVERERRQWRREREKRAQQKKDKHQNIAQRVTQELVGLALLHVEYEKRNGVPTPSKVKREWLAMFLAGDSRLCSEETQLDEKASEEVDETVDGAMLREYMCFEGDWAPKSEDSTAKNEGADQQVSEPKDDAKLNAFNLALGAAIHDIRATAKPPPPDAAPTLDLPVRMAIVGGPFTGKTTLAQTLAEAQNATVIVPENLVQSAILAAAQYIEPQAQIVEEEVECESGDEMEPPQDEPDATAPQEDTAAKPGATSGEPDAIVDGNELAKKKKTKLVSRTINPPPPPRQVEIGRCAQEVLLDGEQMSDDDTAALVAECILQLQTDYNNWRQSNPEESANADSRPSCPQGFVLDGYPRSAKQAMTLEKELTGLDLSSEIDYAAGSSAIAPPPPGTFRSPTRPLKSCLDSVVMLELDDAEAAVSRAVGRRMDPTTGAIYHMDLSPPPGDVPGLLERLQPVKSVSNDTEQLQKRLQVHLQATPPLRKWLQRFDRLLWTISADAPPPDVAKQALAIADIARDSKDAALRCVAAAASADAARKTAELAAEHAKKARQATVATVRELLVAKRAEVEAEQLVRQQNAPDPKAKDTKAKKGAAVEPESEAQKTANAASALLAEQAAQQCAEHLAAGETANRQAHARAEEAAAAAQSATDAAMEAKRSIHDANKSCEAEVRAREAAAAAEVAAQGAAAAAAIASASAERAAQTVSSAQEKLHGPIEELADTAALLEQAGEADEAPVDAAADAEPQAPVVAMQDLDAAAAERLYEMWQVVEKCYIRGGKLAFSGLRKLREDYENLMCESHKAFGEYLYRPDERQEAVTKYQKEVNEIDIDFISDPEVQAELALRVEELRDKLWGMCDAKMEENTKLRSELVDPEIKANTIGDFAQCLSALVQVEIDRFINTAAIARECTCLRFNLPTPLFPKLEPVEILGDSDGDLAPLLDAKTGIPIPEWATVPNMAVLTTSLKRAEAALVRDERNTFAEAARPKSPPKTGGKPPADAGPVIDIAPEVLEASETFCGSILEHDRKVTRARLQGIAARAAIEASDTEKLLTVTGERLQTALKDRFVAECEAVASVVVVLAEAVVKGEQLPYDLQLADDGVIIDMDNRHIPEERVVEYRAPSPGPLAPGLLSLKQISCLIGVAQQVTRDEFMATRDCTDLLQALTWDKGARYGVAFPPEWHDFTWEQMHGALQPMDAQGSCFVDWLEMIAGLLIHARPVLTHVTPRNLADAAIALEAADSDKDGSVTLQEWMDCPIWFQPNLPCPSEDLDPVDDSLDVANTSTEEVLVPATDQVHDDPVAAAVHIKKILWELFATGKHYPDPEDDAFAFGEIPELHAKPADTDAAATEQGGSDPPKQTPVSAAPGAERENGGNTAENTAQDDPASAAENNNTEGAAVGAAPDSNEENTPEDERKLPFVRMLLYLCADYELPVAVRKAFSVIAKDPSPRVKLQAPDIFRMLYPNGPVGKNMFKVPADEPEVTEIIARICGLHVEPEDPSKNLPIKQDANGAKGKAATPKDKPGAKDKGAKKGGKAEEVQEEPVVAPIAEVTSDQFVYHSRGAALLESCGSRYQLRDIFLDFRRIKPYDT